MSLKEGKNDELKGKEGRKGGREGGRERGVVCGNIVELALREARRGRFSNLEQLLEVRAARGEDNLVRLETPTVAG